MPNTKDTSVITTNLNIAVFGDVASGKSIFASTFPTPAFIFDFDKQADTAYRGKGFDYLRYDITPMSWGKFRQDFVKIMSGYILNTSDELVVNTDPALKYKTLVIDSITAMSDLAMKYALTLNPTRSEAGGPVWNIHYSLVKHMIAEIISMYISYSGYKLILGHLKIEKNDRDVVISILPLLIGDLVTRIPGYCSEVLISRREMIGNPPVEQYVLQTGARGLYYARSGLRGVEGYLDLFVPNNFTAIINMVKERRQNALDKASTLVNNKT